MNLVDLLEPRRLFTFATLDSAFGGGKGFAEHDFNYGPSSTYSSLTTIGDGRIVVADQAGVHFLRSDGSLDPKRNKGGVSFRNAAVDVYVDPITGRFAVLRPTREAQSSTGLTVDSYDSKGKRLASRVLDNDFAGANDNTWGFGTLYGAGVSIASDGSMVIAVPSIPRTAGQDVTLEIRRYDASLKPVTTYGNNGVARKVIYPAFTINANHATVSNVFLDANGRAYVAFRTETASTDPGGSTIESKLLRLTTSGAIDTSYGTSGVATFYSYQKANFDSENKPTQRTRNDFGGLEIRLAPDGRAYMTTREVIWPGDGSQSLYAQYGLIRLTADGHGRDEIAVGREGTVGNIGNGMPVTVATSGNGQVYVSTNVFGPTATIFKYIDDGSSLRVDDAWSNFGDFTITASEQTAAASGIDRDGRLIIAGEVGHMQVAAIKGTAEKPASLASGTVKKLPDGSILVNGTPRNDTIDVGTKGGRLTVTLNGKRTDFGKMILRGLVILAGNGDDQVTLGSAIDIAYVETGAGNDRFSSSSKYGTATIVGGSGNDRLVGGNSTDHIYGQGGKDTLAGGLGYDELFGGDDVDQLFASNIVSNLATKTYDGVGDRLDSGSGADVVHVDHDVFADYDDIHNETTLILKAIDLVLGNTSGDQILGQ